MLMYKNQEENKLNQRQVQIQRQMLRTKTDTKTRTELKQKRKLIIYQNNGRYFIDHFAAYSLKLTNVRAVMTGKPHFIEIGPDVLAKLKSDETIDIEYHEVNKKIEAEKSDGTILEELSDLKEGDYGIGAHGIDVSDSVEKATRAESIINNGLTLNNNSKTILSTSVSFGTNNDLPQISQAIQNYKFGAGGKGTIVIAVPLYIQNKNGERIFLGFPEENTKTAAQQYDEHCILDRICSKLGRIPSQFIVGYYQEDQYGNGTFTMNDHHYSKLNEEEKEKLFNECMANMDNISINFNNLIANQNLEQLDQIKKRMEQMGWKSHMADTAIFLARKYQNSQNKEIKTEKQIPENITEQNTVTQEEQPKSKRPIILKSASIRNEITRLREMRNRAIMLKANVEEEVKQSHNNR